MTWFRLDQPIKGSKAICPNQSRVLRRKKDHHRKIPVTHCGWVKSSQGLACFRTCFAWVVARNTIRTEVHSAPQETEVSTRQICDSAPEVPASRKVHFSSLFHVLCGLAVLFLMFFVHVVVFHSTVCDDLLCLFMFVQFVRSTGN